MLSGIGDEIELNALGIPVKKNLHAVGANMKEHVGLSVTGTTNLKCPENAHRDDEGKPKGGTHLGYLNDFLAQFYGFFKLPGTDTWYFNLFLRFSNSKNDYYL